MASLWGVTLLTLVTKGGRVTAMAGYLDDHMA
jgi:hypothetical protein